MFSRNKKNTPPPARPKTKAASGRVAVKSTGKAAAPAPAQPPAPRQRTGGIVHDTIWLFMLVLTAYLAFSLASFRIDDPSVSVFRNIPYTGEVANWGGMIGAYLSDSGYYILGLSVWWTVAAACVWLFKNFRALPDNGYETYAPMLTGIGLGILMLSSPVLEHLFWHGRFAAVLPRDAGGLTGELIASGMVMFLGRGGSMFLLVAMMLLGIKLLIQFSYHDTARMIWGYMRRALPGTASGSRAKVQTDNAAPRNVRDSQADAPPADTAERSAPKAADTAATAAKRVAQVQQKPPPRRTPSGYCLPDLELLSVPRSRPPATDEEKLQRTGDLIVEKLAEFGVSVKARGALPGPVITRYEIEPARGVKGSRIVNLARDLARSLSVQSVRVVETIPGKNMMGIELPNEHRQEVLLQEIIASSEFNASTSKLSVALGKDIGGAAMVGDLAKMPHLLVGGMTGSGKSVGVNAMIMSILYKAAPQDVRFIMIDPKMLELSVYEGIPHLLCPVVTDMKAAGNALNWCVAEMERRYRLMSHIGVRNLTGFNEKIRRQPEDKPLTNPFSTDAANPEPLRELPQIVVVIDELADLMMTEKKTVEVQIARLAQKARAAGIHMIIATQRPSVDVITGLIKANVPTRMAFTVQSRIDSRTILDQMGAEDLLKYGDLLFLQPGEAEPVRIQGAFVSDDEVHRVVAFVKEQGEADYVDGILTGEAAGVSGGSTAADTAFSGSRDELFDRAVEFVVSSRKTSISALQRHLRIGYNRAANLMQELEDNGVVSAPESNGARRILAGTLPLEDE